MWERVCVDALGIRHTKVIDGQLPHFAEMLLSHFILFFEQSVIFRSTETEHYSHKVFNVPCMQFEIATDNNNKCCCFFLTVSSFSRQDENGFSIDGENFSHCNHRTMNTCAYRCLCSTECIWITVFSHKSAFWSIYQLSTGLIVIPPYREKSTSGASI